jgi:hypothetical protein
MIITLIYRPIFTAELESGLRRVIGHRESDILHLQGTYLCIFFCAASFRRALRHTRANGDRQSIDRALPLPYIIVTKDAVLNYLVLAVMCPHMVQFDVRFLF